MGNYHIEIGKQLKARRLEQKKELKDIAKDTKVTEDYLEAIETGRIEIFPSAVYYNLFARSYAQELGMDTDQLFVISSAESLELERIENLGPEAAEKEIQELESKEKKYSVAKTAMWISGFIVIIFIVVLLIFTSGKDAGTPPTASDLNAESTYYAGEEMSADYDIMSDELSDDSLGDNATSVMNPDPKMSLQIESNALSWIRLIADGDTILNGNFEAGHRQTIEADNQFVITAGNPNGLTLKLNDTLLGPISPYGQPARNIEINRLNKDQFFIKNRESNSGETDGGGF